MMTSNPVVAAKRHTDPYAYKPLTTRSRQTLQRSASSQNLSGTQQSQAGNASMNREYSRASSAGSVRTSASARTAASNRSTTSTRSLSKDQVREKMQRPPDIPTCRGGNINVYRCSAEYLEDFWAKQKAENDTRRVAILRSQAEHQRQLEAEAARNPPPSARTRPVLNATVASRSAAATAALKPPARSVTTTTTPKQATTLRPSSASSKPTIDASARKLRTASAAQPASLSPGKSTAGTRSATITDCKPIGSAPRSASAAKKAVQPSSTNVASTRTSSARPVSASTRPSIERKPSASPAQSKSVGKAPSLSTAASSRTSSKTRPAVPSVAPTPPSKGTASRAPSSSQKPTASVKNGTMKSKVEAQPHHTPTVASNTPRGVQITAQQVTVAEVQPPAQEEARASTEVAPETKAIETFLESSAQEENNDNWLS